MYVFVVCRSLKCTDCYCVYSVISSEIAYTISMYADSGAHGCTNILTKYTQRISCHIIHNNNIILYCVSLQAVFAAESSHTR